MLRLKFSVIAIGVGVSLLSATTYAGAQIPKSSQTAAQRKIDSHLLRAIERARNGEPQPPRDTLVQIDAKGRAFVELRADVTEALETRLREIGATIVSALPTYRSILAWIPLTQLEALAASESIYAIHPAPRSTTNKRPEDER